MPDQNLRVDAHRRYERVLDTAVRVLADNPSASIEDIAEASMVHRSTVYRRFATRRDLVDALLERALREISALVGAAAVGEPNESKLHQMCRDLTDVGERYAFLNAHDRIAELGSDPVGLEKVMRRYQRAGLLRRDLTAAWLARVFTAIGVAAIDQLDLSSRTPDATADFFARTFLDGARDRT